MSLYDDAFWPRFAERFANDVPAFAKEVCGIDLGPLLTPWAANASKPNLRLLLDAAGHGDGQAVLLAVIALWHLTTRPDSTAVIITPIAARSPAREWIERLLTHIRHRYYGWLVPYLRADVRGNLKTNGAHTSRIDLRGENRRAPENLCGYWARDLLWIAEDSDRMARDTFRVISGSLVHERCGLVMAAAKDLPAYIDEFMKDGHAWVLQRGVTQ